MPVHSTINTDYPSDPVDCRRCERLAAYLNDVKQRFPDYHAKPVASFGDSRAQLLIVGLAPGLHGANRTGRPFTGDYAGILLYRTLHRYGFASHAESVSRSDDLRLINCRITNAVKCLPPQNKPNPDEIRHCTHYLQSEIETFQTDGGKAILALGAIAHQAVLRTLELRQKTYSFAHGAVHRLPERDAGHTVKLYDSYHCSRYNTQTKRLTTAMFEQVFARITDDLSENYTNGE